MGALDKYKIEEEEGSFNGVNKVSFRHFRSPRLLTSLTMSASRLAPFPRRFSHAPRKPFPRLQPSALGLNGTLSPFGVVLRSISISGT